MMNRLEQLIADVVAQFEKHDPIMDTAWRAERGVTPVEAEQISETCAAVLKGYMALPEPQRREHLIRGAWLEESMLGGK